MPRGLDSSDSRRLGTPAPAAGQYGQTSPPPQGSCDHSSGSADGTLRPREVKQPTPSHTASKWRSRGSFPGSREPEASAEPLQIPSDGRPGLTFATSPDLSPFLPSSPACLPTSNIALPPRCLRELSLQPGDRLPPFWLQGPPPGAVALVGTSYIRWHHPV